MGLGDGDMDENENATREQSERLAVQKAGKPVSDASYYIKTVLMAFLATPILVSLGVLTAFIPILYVLAWIIYFWRVKMPDSFTKRLAPVIGVFCYYLLVWVLFFGMTRYHFDKMETGFILLTLPYMFINIFASLFGNSFIFPVIQIASALATVFLMLIVCEIAKKRAKADRSVFALVAVFLLLSGVSAYQFYDKSTKFLSADSGVAKVANEVDLGEYQPFAENNKLAKPDSAPDIAIECDYPRLDGATAAYPVYAAMAQAIYKGLDSGTIWNYVTCTTTNTAYEYLINGEADIFFGAQPSGQQQDLAAANGVVLKLTPIAKEAFVFFVNSDNPVDSLTVEQIQDIYRKKITNWRAVGGANQRIMPFQRPENSGSQTIMLAKVMGGKPLPPPIITEYPCRERLRLRLQPT